MSLGHTVEVEGTAGSLNSIFKDEVIELPGQRDVLVTKARKAAGGLRRLENPHPNLIFPYDREEAQDHPK